MSLKTKYTYVNLRFILLFVVESKRANVVNKILVREIHYATGSVNVLRQVRSIVITELNVLEKMYAKTYIYTNEVAHDLLTFKNQYNKNFKIENAVIAEISKVLCYRAKQCEPIGNGQN